MDNIILFDPGIRSLNKGDEIIMRSAESELEKAGILKDAYVIHAATHSPIVTFYQNTKRNSHMSFYTNAKYKFICGSNLLWRNMLKPRPVFNVNPFNCLPYENSILFGVGTGAPRDKTNGYTRKLYTRILSKEYVHSVRDDKTVAFLNDLGYKAINTGCPTMWSLTEDFCAAIPQEKASNVVFTLTDYGKNREYDQQLIDVLVKEYDKVYFWIQGAFDKDYFDSFRNTDGIIVVPPSIDAFSRVLSLNDIEYVGTRLHAGMFALQHKKRTITVAIDHRIVDMKDAYDINIIERDKLDQLPQMLNGYLPTHIKLKSENISTWLHQFE